MNFIESEEALATDTRELRDAQRAEYEARRRLTRLGMKNAKLNWERERISTYLEQLSSRTIFAEDSFVLWLHLEVGNECHKWRQLAEDVRGGLLS